MEIQASSVLSAEFPLDVQHSKIGVQLPNVCFQRQTGLGCGSGHSFASPVSPGLEIWGVLDRNFGLLPHSI